MYEDLFSGCDKSIMSIILHYHKTIQPSAASKAESKESHILSTVTMFCTMFVFFVFNQRREKFKNSRKNLNLSSNTDLKQQQKYIVIETCGGLDIYP